MRWSLALAVALIVSVSGATPLARTVLHVDGSAPAGGDGSGRFPFNTIAAAVEAARLHADPMVMVAPGTYAIDESIILEHPIDLRGSGVLLVDSAGLPTGEFAEGTETRLVASAALGVDAIMTAVRTDGAVINDVSVRGFTFVGRPMGIGLNLTRAQNFSVVGNSFRGTPGSGVQTLAASGRIAGNYMKDVGAGAILAAGYDASPANVTFVGNRSIGNFNGGVLLNGSSTFFVEHGDQLTAVIQGNDLSDNNRTARFSFGVRVFAIRRDPVPPGDTQSTGSVAALVRGNRIAGNELGIVIDAGFPYRRFMGASGACDDRQYSAVIDVKLQGNTVTGSLLSPGVISFGRVTTTLNPQNPAQLPQFQYLHNSTFTIADPQGHLAEAIIDHPDRDPFQNPVPYPAGCVADDTRELLGNTLIYNGEPIAESH